MVNRRTRARKRGRGEAKFARTPPTRGQASAATLPCVVVCVVVVVVVVVGGQWLTEELEARASRRLFRRARSPWT